MHIKKFSSQRKKTANLIKKSDFIPFIASNEIDYPRYMKKIKNFLLIFYQSLVFWGKMLYDRDVNQKLQISGGKSYVSKSCY